MNAADKPIVDMLTLRRDLYLVASLLLADKAVTKLPDVAAWTQVFYENEIRRLVLWTAATTRSLLDLLNEQQDRFSDKRCGEFWNDFPDGAKENLSFRQACNSALHAKDIVPHKAPMRAAKKPIKRVYTNRLTIRGAHKGRTTRAQVDIIRFVQIADALINFTEEAGHASF